VKSLPDTVAPYKKTPVFTEVTLPDGLRRDHATKAGVWGLIHIEAGRLLYEISDAGEAIELAPGEPQGVIEPEVRHRVTPIGDVRFYVEFHRGE
jgi:tellurite methyltransferase